MYPFNLKKTHLSETCMLWAPHTFSWGKKNSRVKHERGILTSLRTGWYQCWLSVIQSHAKQQACFITCCWFLSKNKLTQHPPTLAEEIHKWDVQKFEHPFSQSTQFFFLSNSTFNYFKKNWPSALSDMNLRFEHGVCARPAMDLSRLEAKKLNQNRTEQLEAGISVITD